MLPVPADLTIGTTPAAHFGAGAVARLPAVVTAAGGVSVLLVTDALLAATPVAGAVTGALAAAGLPARCSAACTRTRPPATWPQAPRWRPACSRAGLAMASTGLGACHAIGHALGGRFDVPHGVALTMLLPQLLSFSQPACRERLAAVAFALGAGSTAAAAESNAAAAVDAVASLGASVGMTQRLADYGIGPDDFAQLAADALDDEVLANAPVQPTAADIVAMLAAEVSPPR